MSACEHCRPSDDPRASSGGTAFSASDAQPRTATRAEVLEAMREIEAALVLIAGPRKPRTAK